MARLARLAAAAIAVASCTAFSIPPSSSGIVGRSSTILAAGGKSTTKHGKVGGGGGGGGGDEWWAPVGKKGKKERGQGKRKRER